MNQSEIKFAIAAATNKVVQSLLMFGANVRARKYKPHGGQTVLKPRSPRVRAAPNSASATIKAQKKTRTAMRVARLCKP